MRRKTKRQEKVVKLGASAPVELEALMIHYAYQKPALEAVMLHLARAGGFDAVVREIERLRGYARRRNGRKVA